MLCRRNETVTDEIRRITVALFCLEMSISCHDYYMSSAPDLPVGRWHITGRSLFPRERSMRHAHCLTYRTIYQLDFWVALDCIIVIQQLVWGPCDILKIIMAFRFTDAFEMNNI